MTDRGAVIAADIVNNKHPELGNLPLAATEGLSNLGGANLELDFVDHQGNVRLVGTNISKGDTA